MSLLTGSMRHHIPGYKDVTEKKEIQEVKAGSQVLIPLYASHSTKFDVLVKEGDHVCVGTKIAECNDRMYVPIYSSVSGTVKGVQKRMHMTLKPLDHVVIDNDGKMEDIQSFAPLDYQSASREELIAFMKEAGIIGQGGAGFPTYVKYEQAKDIKKLIIDGAECEPYVTADHKMMETRLDDMIVGILAMRKMAQAEEAVIVIKKTHTEILKKVEAAVANVSGVSVLPVADVYPIGWERALVRLIMKKDYDKLPSEVGAIVNNVSTAYAFAKALLKGKGIITALFTVSGDGVANPVNIHCPVGVPVSEVIKECGGYLSEDVKLIAGGPMMGKTIVNEQFVVERQMNAITVLKTKAFDTLSCMRCGQCCDVCPSALQPVRIAQAAKLNDKAMMEKLCAMDCIECGLCAYICPSKLDVTENVRKAKRQLAMAKK